MTQIEDQPPPLKQPGVTSIQALVRRDLDERERVGISRYGTPLQAVNGRDPLVDAYQEALDLACYIRQELAEREGVETIAQQLGDARRELVRKDDLIVELRQHVTSLERRLDEANARKESAAAARGWGR